MSGPSTTQRPGWQTFELDEEWPDEEDEPSTSTSTDADRSSLSFTAPVGSIITRDDIHISRSKAPSPDSPPAGGTFLIREDAPGPILPKTPGQKKNAIKDFFSPLALEKMFEPPSPPKGASSSQNPNPSAPIVPSRLSQVHAASSFSVEGDTEIIEDGEGGGDEILETDLPNVGAFDGLRPGGDCQFTFAVPRLTPGSNAITPTGVPQAESTPGAAQFPHANVPTTTPLRLFQFQYDTFTRDHLSAMVDSIAVNSPSRSNTGNFTSTPAGSSPFGFSRGSELTAASSTDARSAKRVKLSPVSDFVGEGDGANAIIQRPTLRRDYVGESKSLMAQIKQAKDFSTISTVASSASPASAKDFTPPAAGVPSVFFKARASSLEVPGGNGGKAEGSTSGTSRESRGSGSTYSSLAYRERGANLLAQIKADMKGSKRLFSAESDVSQAPDAQSEVSFARSVAENSRPPHHRRTSHNARRNVPPSPNQSSSRIHHGARGRAAASPRRAMREEDGSQDGLDSSMDTSRLYAQFPAPPIVVAPPLCPRHSSLHASTSHSSGSSAQPQDWLRPANRTSPANPNPTPVFLSVPGGGDAPAYPSSSIRAHANDDLNRFVSSSTASGTTLTANSAASFVKHPGPAQITRIAPEDVPALPDRVGKMVFDKVMMRWVKSTVEATRAGPVSDGGYAASAEGEGESEDPFRDIESLREDGSDHTETRSFVFHGHEADESGDEGPQAPDMTRIEEVEDEEEAELTSFSFDGPPPGMLSSSEDGAIIEDDATTDSDHDDDEVYQLSGDMDASLSFQAPSEEPSFDDFPPDDPDPPLQARPVALYTSSPAFSTPVPPPRPTISGSTPLRAGSTPIRSALKSTSTTPFASLRDPSQSRTPMNRYRHRRSVSFSDGKRDGPIRDLRLEEGEDEEDEGGQDDGDRSAHPAASSFVPSARSKRIADFMDGLVDTTDDGGSPSKASGSGPASAGDAQPLVSRRPHSGPASLGEAFAGPPSRRVFSRSHAMPTPTEANSSSKANATFLTEASFGVAHDKLVQVITDVQPFEPYWEDLPAIDLSGKGLDSVARLKEFLPQLRSLSLNNNQLAWLSGIPNSVRTLSIAQNALTRVTSFNQLLFLESLDVSHNNIDSLNQLECLRHLRELRADGNRIASLDGLAQMDNLAKLSLQENRVVSADFTQCAWAKLEVLNLSHNRVERIAGLSTLASLIVLNLDNNSLGEVETQCNMPRLRILRLSANRLKTLHATHFPNLRTLYADNNALGQIVKANRLAKLENLSLRNQGGKGLTLSVRDVRDVKRLYLSGNPLQSDFMSEACYNLIYLEIAACRLSVLPANLSQLVPNLRVLNLNYNFLEDVRALEGLRRLTKLTIIGSRLKGTKGLIRVLRGCPDAEMVDFRMNPCTLGWYLPLLVKDVPGALQPSEPGHRGSKAGTSSGSAPGDLSTATSSNTWSGERAGGGGGGSGGGSGASWQELDAKFRRDLPDEAYVGRLAYRGLVMRACGRVRLVDGVVVSRKEREKAEKLLEGVARAKAAKAVSVRT
ncbi:hypothetical protein OF83DRAFT_1120218 [Amylostereum chailletii]|nr:hypothetical protein OF83DRAFT_1120218 [Amylostereum chailletii]